MINTKRRYGRIAAAVAVVVLCLVALVIPASAAEPYINGEGELLTVTDDGTDYILYFDGEEYGGIVGSLYMPECGYIVSQSSGCIVSVYIVDPASGESSKTLYYKVGTGFIDYAPETSATVVDPDPVEPGESTGSTDRDDDALDESERMSLYRISRTFIVFFLDGADASIIDWFACCLTLGVAAGVLGVFVYPCSLIWKKVKK